MVLFPLKAIDQIDLAELTRPNSPNTAFVAPAGYSIAQRDADAPEFECAWSVLADTWDRIVPNFPRTTEKHRSGDGKQRTYVQRTALMGYPDIITVEFVSLGDDRSSLAIYSRSQYGYSDFGANRRRVTAWIEALSQS